MAEIRNFASPLSRRNALRFCAIGAGAVVLGGCESLQDLPHLFERRTPPLPGQREPVFPGGTPGIDRTIPQPANAPPDVQPQQAPSPAQPAQR